MTTNRKRAIRNTLLFLCVIIAVAVLIMVSCYITVVVNASGRTYDKVEDVPETEFALLLGTSPITPGGARNLYFDNRIKSTVELYRDIQLMAMRKGTAKV